MRNEKCTLLEPSIERRMVGKRDVGTKKKSWLNRRHWTNMRVSQLFLTAKNGKTLT